MFLGPTRATLPGEPLAGHTWPRSARDALPGGVGCVCPARARLRTLGQGCDRWELVAAALVRRGKPALLLKSGSRAALHFPRGSWKTSVTSAAPSAVHLCCLPRTWGAGCPQPRVRVMAGSFQIGSDAGRRLHRCPPPPRLVGGPHSPAEACGCGPARPLTTLGLALMLVGPGPGAGSRALPDLRLAPPVPPQPCAHLPVPSPSRRPTSPWPS